MRPFRWSFPLLAFLFAGPVWGQEAKATPTPVPYKLTDTQHVMVRVKINGKGPFNFIVDTGAPMVIISTPIAKKLGLETDAKGWATVDTLELEGGLKQEKFKCLVTSPFQLEGMNGMGLAGVELHGILGYMLLARYRMEFDFTKDKMNWTALDFKPPPPEAIAGKGNPTAGLEILGGLMKFLGAMAGMKPAEAPLPRGFVGLELAEAKDGVEVKAILPQSPAGMSDVKAGDRLVAIGDKDINTFQDAQKQTARVLPGQEVRLTVLRNGEKKEIKIKAGEGL
ncbi:MAG: PDZ domain-containing protein [Planctomycetes bacterium]|nr:PDZ domain-containing protein [Planctomycetota bacterium]